MLAKTKKKKKKEEEERLKVSQCSTIMIVFLIPVHYFLM